MLLVTVVMVMVMVMVMRVGVIMIVSMRVIVTVIVAAFGDRSGKDQLYSSMGEFNLVPLLRIELVEHMGEQGELFVVDVLCEELQCVKDLLAMRPVLKLGMEDPMFGDQLRDVLVELPQGQYLREQTNLFLGGMHVQEIAELLEDILVIGPFRHLGLDLLAQLAEAHMLVRQLGRRPRFATPAVVTHGRERIGEG
ncbi:MAG TPA: hypothetical protein VL068_09330 [Microthrixaceae bacterium]|nr:hypothetical protein [Microthrixaceae bacterium]